MWFWKTNTREINKKRSCLELSGKEMVVHVLQKGFIPVHFKRPKTFLGDLWVDIFNGPNITLGISKIDQRVLHPHLELKDGQK